MKKILAIQTGCVSRGLSNDELSSEILFCVKNEQGQIFTLFYNNTHQKIYPIVETEQKKYILPFSHLKNLINSRLYGLNLVEALITGRHLNWTFSFSPKNYDLTIMPKLVAAGFEMVISGRAGLPYDGQKTEDYFRFTTSLISEYRNEQGEVVKTIHHNENFSGPISVETLDNPLTVYRYGPGAGGYWSFEPPQPHIVDHDVTATQSSRDMRRLFTKEEQSFYPSTLGEMNLDKQQVNCWGFVDLKL